MKMRECNWIITMVKSVSNVLAMGSKPIDFGLGYVYALINSLNMYNNRF